MNGSEEKIDYKAKTKAFLADWTQVAKKKWWLYIVELAVIALILVADLLSKKYVWNFLDQNGVQENVIGLFNLVKVKNEGAGFGIFQGKTIALTIITFIVVIAICVYLFFALKESEWLRISLVFVTAGGIGNIVDRIAFGYVRDFIQFSFWDSFPVFNIADSFVTVGAFMLVVVLIVMLVKEGNKNQKEFEEEQKNKVANEQEQIDPLDAPINLNPMMKSQNDYSFVVSEKKDEQDEQDGTENAQIDVKNTEENTQNSTENTEKNTQNNAENTQNQGDNTAENTEKNADEE